jgi:hypothetical protein
MWLLQTVHRDVAAVDPVCAWRGEKHDHTRHLLGGAETAHRKTVADLVFKIAGVDEAVVIPSVPIDQDRARRDRVHPDPIRHELERPPLVLEN